MKLDLPFQLRPNQQFHQETYQVWLKVSVGMRNQRFHRYISENQDNPSFLLLSTQNIEKIIKIYLQFQKMTAYVRTKHQILEILAFQWHWPLSNFYAIN